jgi:non-canonical (house-cleaning) NTP pyrophosphatase
MDNGAEVPQEIADAREDLRELSDTTETEINELTTKEGVITYDFPNI